MKRRCSWWFSTCRVSCWSSSYCQGAQLHHLARKRLFILGRRLPLEVVKMVTLIEPWSILSSPPNLDMRNQWKWWKHYSDGNINKEELESTLRIHKAAIDATKSAQTEAAEEFISISKMWCRLVFEVVRIKWYIIRSFHYFSSLNLNLNRCRLEDGMYLFCILDKYYNLFLSLLA